jgi:hypothetical protein
MIITQTPLRIGLLRGDGRLAARPVRPGEDGRDDMVAEGEQGGDGAGAVRRDMVAADPAGFIDELLAAELAQVIGGLPGGVSVVAGHRADLGGVVGGSDPPLT